MIAQQCIIPIRVSGVIAATGDSKAKWKAPYAGELLSVSGFIETLGTGAGSSTDFQLRDATDGNKDMLSTVGAFEVDSATNLLEGAVVEDENACFAKDDIIHLDCDAVTTNTDSADAVLYLVVVLFVDDV